MNSNWKLIALLGILAACGGDDEKESSADFVDRDTSDGGDDGSTGQTGTTDGCTVQAIALDPEEGTFDVYYRDTMGVTFDDDASALSPVVSLTDADGGSVTASLDFDDTGFKAVITPDAPLMASTTYTLSVDVCGNTNSASFTTSEYGAPLTIATEDLAGSTYNFNLGGADYTRPEGLGEVLASFLDAPLLIGVGTTDGDNIQILGTQGQESGGSVTADPSFPIWDFGTATLDGAYFKSATTDIELEYGCATIPIYGFQLEGTFSADGTLIGGGSATGLGDSREMGCLASLGSDPDAICGLAATFGLACETCPDGNPWCLTIEGWFDPAPVLPDVSLSLEDDG